MTYIEAEKLAKENQHLMSKMVRLRTDLPQFTFDNENVTNITLNGKEQIISTVEPIEVSTGNWNVIVTFIFQHAISGGQATIWEPVSLSDIGKIEDDKKYVIINSPA